MGDSMLLVDENIKQSNYKMARAQVVFTDSDGIVRSAIIRTKNGTLKRIVVKLAPVLYQCFEDQNRAGVVRA